MSSLSILDPESISFLTNSVNVILKELNETIIDHYKSVLVSFQAHLKFHFYYDKIAHNAERELLPWRRGYSLRTAVYILLFGSLIPVRYILYHIG